MLYHIREDGIVLERNKGEIIMGISSNGVMAFGIDLGEGDDLPWREFDDIDEWWNSVSGFNPSVNPYADDSSESSMDDINTYHDEKKLFEEENPLPIELVWHCSYEYPMFILAVNDTEMSASRGYPVEFNPSDMVITEAQIQVLKDFCEKYEIEYSEPKWYLCSILG